MNLIQVIFKAALAVSFFITISCKKDKDTEIQNFSKFDTPNLAVIQDFQLNTTINQDYRWIAIYRT
jgi:hypothetical protein